jgi:hypothetical protein
MPFTLTSPAFTDGGAIPARHSCMGADLSPPLEWSGAPEGTSAYALVVHDPDARDFVHWVVADIPAHAGGLPEGVPASGPGAPPQGLNDFGRPGWAGPCPPPGSGDHHYVFTLHALRRAPAAGAHPSAAEVRTAVVGLVLGTAVLEGTFRR